MHKYTAFFCGCFATNKNPTIESLKQSGWIPEDSDIIRNEKRRHFYEEFINFCAAKTPNDGCVAWLNAISVDGTCKNMLQEDCTYHIPYLHFYQLPFKLVVFAIEVTKETTSLDEIKSVAFHIRKLNIPSEVKTTLLDLHRVFSTKEYENVLDIIEYGYRLKFFQIIETDADWDSEDRNTRLQTLYRLGTMENESMEVSRCFCKEYVDKILQEHSLSVFNNWDALSLLDSFTIHAYRPQFYLSEIWKTDFYRMIYIQSLFQKYFLQNLNQRFRAMTGQREEHKNIKGLLAEFETYERICQFHKISYTFLPLLVDGIIDKGLEIKEERAQLTEYIEREQNRQMIKNEKIVNLLLLAISSMALLSAFWDSLCLTEHIGYAKASLIFLIVLALLILLIMSLKNNMFRRNH